MSTFEIFPTPSVVPPSQSCPTIWPGVTTESTAKLLEVLKDNHTRWNNFFNDKGFHNHVSHHTLAIWALGGPAAAIDAAYRADSTYQRPQPETSVVITEENWVEHLGDQKLFGAFIAFFRKSVEERGIEATVEKYVFSLEANFTSKSGSKQPEMANRFVAGLFHCMIHTGYGFEFELPGMVIEGLATTALHQAEAPPLVPKELWSQTLSMTAKMNDLHLNGSSGTHAFTIMARMLKDPELEHPAGKQAGGVYEAVIKKYGSSIAKYAAQWTCDPSEVDRKVEELQWMGVMLYGISGWSKDKPFVADFFLMHFVTASLFLPSFVARLSNASKVILLRSYFAVALAWWIDRGRLGMDIAGFYAADTAHPFLSEQSTPPNYWSLLSESSPSLASVPNPWGPIIDMAIASPDEHLGKLQRALAHYGRLYGTRGANWPEFSQTELPGAEKLDGTLFIRAAGLTYNHIKPLRNCFVWDGPDREEL